MLLASILLFASLCQAATPLPSVSTGTIEANTLDLYRRIKADSIRYGNPVKTNVELSSSVHIGGNIVIDGNLEIKSSATLSGGLFGLFITSYTAKTIAAGTSFPQIANSAFSVCHGTITLTTRAGQSVFIFGGGAVYTPDTNYAYAIYLLRDGGFINSHGGTSAGAYSSGNFYGSGSTLPAPITELDTPGAGTHSYCVGASGTDTGHTYVTPYRLGAIALP